MDKLSRGPEDEEDRATAKAERTTGKEALDRGPGDCEGNKGQGRRWGHRPNQAGSAK